MKHIRTLLLLLSGLMAMPLAFSQDISTQGTEFWVSFIGNGYKTNAGNWVINQVLISSKRDCSGIIENPNTGWSQEFIVRANNITTINNLDTQAYVETSEYESIVNKGLRIVTTDTVSVFCTNIANKSFDASYVLPIQALADDYLMQSYLQSTYFDEWLHPEIGQYLTSAFLIVATEDNTTVDITPTVNSFSGNLHAGEEFTIELNAGEVYQFRSTSSGNHRDLSGTRVTARDCKKIAVFNGNTLTAIPDSRESRDIIFEQAMPLQSWGKNFIVTGSYGRNSDYVKVTSSADNNDIFKNGELLVSLNAGESHMFSLSNEEASCFIEATYSAAVFLYNTSYDNTDQSGDPSMVWIAPVEQRIDEITFTTFNESYYATIDHHFVNIIVKSEDISQVYFDNEQVSPFLFRSVNGNENFSYARIEIQNDVHHLSCVNGFNAHVYGFGEAKGYAYLVGSKATNLITTLVINDIIVQPNGSFDYCIEEPITFSAEINAQNYQLEWDFGDGSPTSQQNPVSHTYHERRVYRPTLVVNSDASGCSSSDSDTTAFHIDLRQKYAESEHDAVCMGAFYTGHGFSNVLITSDTILGRLQENPDNPNCPDSLLVYITAWPTTYTPITDSRCWTGEPGIYEDHGFSFEYDHPDTYIRELPLQSVNGCDSIVTLTLYVDEYQLPNPPIDVVRECYNFGETPYYKWERNGEEFHEDTYKEIILPDPNGGCDFKYTLDLKFHQAFHETQEPLHECNQYIWEVTGETITGAGTHHLYKNFRDDGLSDCDSIYERTVTISDEVTLEAITLSDCDSIVLPWHNDQTFTFYTDSLYTLIGSTEDGCVLKQNVIVHGMTYSPNPTKMECTTHGALVFAYDWADADTVAVVTNTEFFSFQYKFRVKETNKKCLWESCTWDLVGTPSWTFFDSTDLANGISECTVYVADRQEDFVELTTTISNDCNTIQRKIYLKSSFLGLDEQNAVRPDLSIVPNPNKGEMELRFEQMTGKISLKVYDMRGTLIDQFETFNSIETNTLPYNLRYSSAGIYYFVATALEGTVAKKVVIE